MFFVCAMLRIFSFVERLNAPFNSASPHYTEHSIFQLINILSIAIITLIICIHVMWNNGGSSIKMNLPIWYPQPSDTQLGIPRLLK